MPASFSNCILIPIGNLSEFSSLRYTISTDSAINCLVVVLYTLYLPLFRVSLEKLISHCQ